MHMGAWNAWIGLGPSEGVILIVVSNLDETVAGCKEAVLLNTEHLYREEE